MTGTKIYAKNVLVTDGDSNLTLCAHNLSTNRALAGLGITLEVRNIFDLVDQQPGSTDNYNPASGLTMETIGQDGRVFRARIDYAF